jgi:hypothetical protein
MRLPIRTAILASAAVLGLAGLALSSVPASAATSNVTVAATQPPAGLLPGNSATSTVTLANPGSLPFGPTKVKITLPAASAGAPTVTLTAAPGVTCKPKATMPLVQVCKVATLQAGGTATVGTLTGTPPADIGSGISTSVKVAGPFNSVTVTWQWGLPELVTAVSLTPGTIELGQSVTGTLTVTNVSNGTATSFITETPLPSQATPDTLISETQGTDCIPYDSELWCAMPGLAPGAAITVVWSFEPQSGPSAQVTSTADTGGQVVQSSRAGDVATSNVVTVLGTGARLTVSASNPDPLPQGSNFDRTITVTNTGDTPAYNTTVNDWTFSTFPFLGTVSGGPCGLFYTSSGGRVPHPVLAGESCTLGTVPAGGSVSVTYEAEATPTLSPTTYTSKLTASTSTPQSTTATSAASITIVVPTSPVAPALISAPAAPSGNVVVGDVLSTGTGSWNGTPPIGFAYQWSDCDASGTVCTPISGANGPTYTVQPTDVGSTIESTVTASNGGGSASATTPPTVAAVPAVIPTISIAPYVAPLGEPALGTTYDASTGTWNGTPTITYAYQWYDCNATGTKCTAIVGATGSSYVLAATDFGHYLRAVVTATNSGGSADAASNLSLTPN